jgi:hypothetical protein
MGNVQNSQKMMNPQIAQLLAPQGPNLYVEPNVFLTPESLMVYCQTRLRDLDTQIQAAFTKQKNAQISGTAIREALEAFNNCATRGFNLEQGQAAQDLIGCLQEKINRLEALDPHSMEVMRLKDLQLRVADRVDGSGTLRAILSDKDRAWNEYWNNGAVHGKSDKDMVAAFISQGYPMKQQDPVVTGDNVKQWVQDLQGIQADINAGTEMGMIQLQSIMSQRQTALQLTTNLVQALGDQMKQIAGNIGK